MEIIGFPFTKKGVKIMNEIHNLRAESKSLTYLKCLTAERTDKNGRRHGFINPLIHEDFSKIEVRLGKDELADWQTMKTFQEPFTVTKYSERLQALVTYSEGDVSLDIPPDKESFDKLIKMNVEFYWEFRP